MDPSSDLCAAKLPWRRTVFSDTRKSKASGCWARFLHKSEALRLVKTDALAEPAIVGRSTWALQSLQSLYPHRVASLSRAKSSRMRWRILLIAVRSYEWPKVRGMSRKETEQWRGKTYADRRLPQCRKLRFELGNFLFLFCAFFLNFCIIFLNLCIISLHRQKPGHNPPKRRLRFRARCAM